MINTNELPETSGPAITVSHVGICVADIERSLRFYCDGLGFVVGVQIPLDDPQTRQLIGLSGEVQGKSQFISLGPVALELIHFDVPSPITANVPRPMNQFGFTHLSLRVKDVDVASAHLETLGGQVIRSSRISYDSGGIKGDLVFCLDPDGNRVELMRFPDEIRFY